MYKIYYYENDTGQQPFMKWLKNLDSATRSKITIRLGRLKLGNFGFCRGIGSNILELKIDYGPGYRIYFSFLESPNILILLAGAKNTQSEDIEKAKMFLKQFKIEEKTNAKKKL